MTDSFKRLVPPGATVKEFVVENLSEGNAPTYQSIKSTFIKEANSPKNSRFLLSEMVQDHLNVEAEEERRFNEKVQAEVEKVLAQVKTEAHAEGHKEGLEIGRNEAYEEEKARLAALLENLSHTINYVTDGRKDMVERYEAQLVDLVFRMASVVVEYEVETNRDAVTSSIKAILEKIAQDEDVRIRLSSTDLSIAKSIEEEMKLISHRGRVTFELDQSLAKGDCVVESSSGEIASFVAEKLKKLRTEIGRAYPLLENDGDEEETGS